MAIFEFSVQIEGDLSSSPEVGPPAVKEMVLEQVVRTMDDLAVSFPVHVMATLGLADSTGLRALLAFWTW